MDEIVVSLKYGKIQGVNEKSFLFETEFYSFYGVPYAEPPINNLRFKDPVKVKPWKGTRNGFIKKEGCLQLSVLHQRLMGSEDCLYVNVHTPNLPHEGEPLKAVVAFIHLGGHQWGSPDPIHHGSPDFVMHHDIVYVTIGYRLNIFGFLDLKMPECSGNQGLKDVVMAFQWIQENIHAFNGDPTNVTAMGISSGASIIHLLMLSPSVNGLFHKAILSGQYMFNILVPYRTNQVELAFEFAHELGFKGDDKKKLLKFLKKFPGHLMVTQMTFFRRKLNMKLCKAFEGGIFMETTDGWILPDSPRRFIQSMERIPIIFGITDNESTFAFPELSTINKSYLKQSMWGWTYDIDDNDFEEMNQQIKSFYYKNDDKKSELAIKMDILTDAGFADVYDTLINPISADLSSSVYIYKFQYEGEIGFTRNSFTSILQEPVQGTFHCDDAFHWAHTLTPNTNKTKKVIDTFGKLLTNFAKTGNPNYEGIEVQWKSTTPEKPCYLNIKDQLELIDGKLNGKRFEFWDNLMKQYKRDRVQQ